MSIKEQKIKPTEVEALITENERLTNEIKRLSNKIAFLSEPPTDIKDQMYTKQLRFGEGYLTAHEANHLLNNLPLEISFIDKNDIFKYFNEELEPSEMMFVRTSDMIGDDMGRGHPSKSHRKVMTLIS